MGYRRRAGGGKRDLAEPAIIQALEAVGCRVYQLSGTGNPDLLAWRGRPFVMEVKTGQGRRTKAQQGAPWPVVRTVAEALAVLELPPQELPGSAGNATVNPKTRRTEHIALTSVKVLDPFLGQQGNDFFAGLSLEQLTKAQGVDPNLDLRALENAWPEDEDVDSFLAAIEQGHN